MSSKPHLPVSRINTIMKSCADVEIVSKESSQVLAKATELFIRQLAQDGYGMTNRGKKLAYKHLSEVVHFEDKYDFLNDIMPKKITVREYKEILAKLERGEDDNSSAESSSQEEGSETEDSAEDSS